MPSVYESFIAVRDYWNQYQRGLKLRECRDRLDWSGAWKEIIKSQHYFVWDCSTPCKRVPKEVSICVTFGERFIGNGLPECEKCPLFIVPLCPVTPKSATTAGWQARTCISNLLLMIPQRYYEDVGKRVDTFDCFRCIQRAQCGKTKKTQILHCIDFLLSVIEKKIPACFQEIEKRWHEWL